MARKAQTKVYRTAIGFHDAYVAAVSQKAALEAWGSDKNLFARGVAELVTDPALTEEALASPGKVIRRLRGSADEQMAALPPDRPRRKTATDDEKATAKRRPAPRPRREKPLPPPSRAKLERVDEALEALEADARDRLAGVTRREKELASEKRALLVGLERDRAKLTKQRERERQDYERDLAKWREA